MPRSEVDTLVCSLLALKTGMSPAKWRDTILEALTHLGAANGGVMVTDGGEVIAFVGLAPAEAEDLARSVVVGDPITDPRLDAYETLTIPVTREEHVLLALCSRHGAPNHIDLRSIMVEGLPVIALLIRANALTSKVA